MLLPVMPATLLCFFIMPEKGLKKYWSGSGRKFRDRVPVTGVFLQRGRKGLD